MSDTPLTDEQVLAYLTEDGSELVHASTARELEIELNATKAEANNQSTLALMFIDRALKAEAELAAAIKKSDTKDEIIHLMRDQLEKAETRLDVMIARAEKAEAELAKRDSEYLRGANMVAESASVWQTRAEKAEAELAAANVEIENLIWNLAGCSTIAESGKPTDYSHELARPALHDVNKLAARAEKAEAELVRLRAQEGDYIKIIAEVLECEQRSACEQPDNQLEAPWEVVARLRKEVKRLNKAIKVDTPKMVKLNNEILTENGRLLARAEKAEAKIITARSALSRIANKRKHRGNRSLESQIAFAALEEIK